MTPPMPCVRADLLTWLGEMVQGGFAAALADGAALATVGVAIASRLPPARIRAAARPHRWCAFFIASSVIGGHPGCTPLTPNGTEAEPTIWPECQQLRQILMKLVF